MSRRWSAILGLAWLALPLSAQVQSALSAQPMQATVGDRVELRLIVRVGGEASGLEVDWPAGDYEIVGRQAVPPRAQGSDTVLEAGVTLAFFATGPVSIGPVPFRYRDREGHVEQGTAAPLTVRILTVLTPRDTDIGPPKPPVALAGSPARLLWPLLVAMLALLGWFLWRLRRRVAATPVPSPPPLEPEEELTRRVQELMAGFRDEPAALARYHEGLGRALRRFLRRRLAVPADELTSPEIMRALDGNERDPQAISGVAEVLGVTDLVKFAKFAPVEADNLRVGSAALGLAELYRRRREAARQVPPAP